MYSAGITILLLQFFFASFNYIYFCTVFVQKKILKNELNNYFAIEIEEKYQQNFQLYNNRLSRDIFNLRFYNFHFHDYLNA